METLAETQGGRIQAPYLLSPQRVGSGGSTTMNMIPGDSTSSSSMQFPQQQLQPYLRGQYDGVQTTSPSGASGSLVPTNYTLPQLITAQQATGPNMVDPYVQHKQIYQPDSNITAPISQPTGGPITYPGQPGTSPNHGDAVPPTSQPPEGGGYVPGTGGAPTTNPPVTNPTNPAEPVNQDPNAVGLNNLGALIERLLANPSGFTSDQAQQYRDMASVERNERRGVQTAGINADAARRGLFHSSVPVTSIGDLETSLGREESMLDANLQQAVAMSQQQGLRDAIQAALGFGQLGLQENAGMANIANLLLGQGFNGAPDFNVMMSGLLGMGGGQQPQMDSATIGMLLATMFGGQGGSSGGGIDWASILPGLLGSLGGADQGGIPAEPAPLPDPTAPDLTGL